ncbi:cell division protein FtsX [Fodinibius sediminis]|uniref:Cell division protein FtsX n=1 Tax=Fodinibius sediminis TaxID=1214077 RepID=A0A521DB34_9BACT|nr:permease-like cell division protein FtsX [Fodinibius sediminis]SMO68944.1 cell division protein FtsX [Fodinibius sediminis]
MSLGYVIKEGFAGFRRARLASFTAVFSLFVAILLLGVLARVSYNAYEVAQSLKQSIDIEVFLNEIDDNSLHNLRTTLEEEELVQEVTYISQDSAAAIFKDEFGTGAAAMAELNFLPASFRLVMTSDTDIGRIDSLVSEIETYESVDEVRFNQQLLQMMEQRFQTVATAGGGLGVLILLAALILVFNTIRLTIYAKRDLIKAMKLVGATNGFIRRPFVVEGVIQGTIAGILAMGVMYLVFHFVLPQYVPQFGILAWPFGRWYYLSGAMLFLSIFMGYWGSQWAARKFIKQTSISQ